jgi:hypothetical protein
MDVNVMIANAQMTPNAARQKVAAQEKDVDVKPIQIMLIKYSMVIVSAGTVIVSLNQNVARMILVVVGKEEDVRITLKLRKMIRE